jgi:hypothetical protein
MVDEQSQADAELEREIREGRKFTLAEAIGRLADPGAMKGASPVGRKQQAEVAITNWLSCELLDSSGALRTVLLRRVSSSELLLANYDQPLVTLTDYCQSLLDSDYTLQDFVREVDVEWGRVIGEKPHFDKQGVPPHPDDAYTLESVRESIMRILEKLARVNSESLL